MQQASKPVLSVWQPLCLSICLSGTLSVWSCCKAVCLAVSTLLSFCLSVRPSVCIYLSVCMYICIYVCLSVCLFLSVVSSARLNGQSVSRSQKVVNKNYKAYSRRKSDAIITRYHKKSTENCRRFPNICTTREQHKLHVLISFLDDSCSSQTALEEASRICSQEFDIKHSTIQVETSSEKTAECIPCDEPTI